MGEGECWHGCIPPSGTRLGNWKTPNCCLRLGSLFSSILGIHRLWTPNQNNRRFSIGARTTETPRRGFGTYCRSLCVWGQTSSSIFQCCWWNGSSVECSTSLTAVWDWAIFSASQRHSIPLRRRSSTWFPEQTYAHPRTSSAGLGIF